MRSKKNNRLRRKNQSGSAVLFIVGAMVLLSAIVDATLISFNANTRFYQAFQQKDQAFYMSQGVQVLATTLVESYLMNNPSPASSDVQQYLNQQLPSLIPSPYSLSNISVTIVKSVANAIIPSGPYAGMNGPVTQLSLSLNLISPSSVFSGTFLQPLNLQMSISYISMFEFMMFYDVNLPTLSPGPDMSVNGRLHSNHDLCLGSDSGMLSVLKATVGGRLMAMSDARCTSAGVANIRIATDPTFTHFASLTSTNDNGCANCAGTGLPWQTYSLATWNQQAMDQALGVQLLKLPGAGMGLTQTKDAGNWATVANTTNLRFVIDPVLATDSTQVAAYKYSSNADIRIINGVWYIKDPANPFSWPGLPVWSDHPGSFVENGLNVGQSDIRAYWSGILPWPVSPATPRGYSYYEYDTVNQTIFSDAVGVGVISYGNLVNKGGATPFRPGQWIAGPKSTICLGNNVSCGAGGCGLIDVWGGPITCSLVPSPSFATDILNATRGGFRDGHIYSDSPGTAATQASRSVLLPVNFDVAQFQAALNNTSPGELGSYFGATGFRGQAFNGIIYISSVWPGGNNGYGTGGPSEYPFQGSIADANQIGRSDNAAVQQALPQPLCSNATGAAPAGLAGNSYDSDAGTPRFKIPDCANYTVTGAYPNVVRVINGASLSAATFPKGVSIVSNLPVYIMGDFNTSSVTTTSTSAPWVSSLIAADRLTALSNNWSDKLSRWDQNPANTHRCRPRAWSTITSWVAIATRSSE